jgi:hypothetical protein
MPARESAVRAVELTKQYHIYPCPIDRLLETVTRRPRHIVFPALQDVTFEVEPGESVGIATCSPMRRRISRVPFPSTMMPATAF